MADQLKGPSSIDGFISALHRGCRCLDIQCFDGTDGQPTIHNGTLTSRIPLSEALEVINTYAFDKTEYDIFIYYFKLYINFLFVVIHYSYV